MKTVIAICALVLAGCFAEPVDIGEPELAPLVDVTAECVEEHGERWAVADFPGRTWDELAAVHAVAHNAGTFYPFPGYELEQVAVFVKDEQVTAPCRLAVGAADEVHFFLR